MYDIQCAGCENDLEQWNVAEYTRIRYCPHCGVKLPDNQVAELRRKTSNDEIDDIIRQKIEELLDDADEIHAEDLSFRVWESENVDGVVFYSNYKADQFAMRHSGWINEALSYTHSVLGDGQHYSEVLADCVDRFLVIAFICATEHYIHHQIGVDICEGKLTKRRIAQIKQLVKETKYDGGF